MFLDVQLPAKIVHVIITSRIEFCMFWNEQAKIAHHEWSAKHGKRPVIALV